MALNTSEILEMADLYTIIQSYGVDLTEQGKDYIAFCPFHSDQKSKSFRLYSSTQSFYCFGCKFGGNSLDFIMKMDKIPFRDAIEKLAREVGYDENEFSFRELRSRTKKVNVSMTRERIEMAATKLLRNFYLSLNFDSQCDDNMVTDIDNLWKWYDEEQLQITEEIIKNGYNSTEVSTKVYKFYNKFTEQYKSLYKQYSNRIRSNN